MKKDRFLLCYDCGERFKFPVEERAFYKQMKYQEPCHCRWCRTVRRQVITQEARRMKRRNRHANTQKGSKP